MKLKADNKPSEKSVEAENQQKPRNLPKPNKTKADKGKEREKRQPNLPLLPYRNLSSARKNRLNAMKKPVVPLPCVRIKKPC